MLALIDADRGASRFMILIRGSGSFAYRGFYAVNVRLPTPLLPAALTKHV